MNKTIPHPHVPPPYKVEQVERKQPDTAEKRKLPIVIKR